MSTWVTYPPNHWQMSKSSTVQFPFSLLISQKPTGWAGGRSKVWKIPTTWSWVVGSRTTEDPMFSLSLTKAGWGSPKHKILGRRVALRIWSTSSSWSWRFRSLSKKAANHQTIRTPVMSWGFVYLVVVVYLVLVVWCVGCRVGVSEAISICISILKQVR